MENNRRVLHPGLRAEETTILRGKLTRALDLIELLAQERDNAVKLTDMLLRLLETQSIGKARG